MLLGFSLNFDLELIIVPQNIRSSLHYRAPTNTLFPVDIPTHFWMYHNCFKICTATLTGVICYLKRACNILDPCRKSSLPLPNQYMSFQLLQYHCAKPKKQSSSTLFFISSALLQATAMPFFVCFFYSVGMQCGVGKNKYSPPSDNILWLDWKQKRRITY